MEIIKIPFLERTKLINIKGKENDSIGGAFLLGFTFSLGWTPCAGPIASILFISSGEIHTMEHLWCLFTS